MCGQWRGFVTVCPFSTGKGELPNFSFLFLYSFRLLFGWLVGFSVLFLFCRASFHLGKILILVPYRKVLWTRLPFLVTDVFTVQLRFAPSGSEAEKKSEMVVVSHLITKFCSYFHCLVLKKKERNKKEKKCKDWGVKTKMDENLFPKWHEVAFPWWEMHRQEPVCPATQLIVPPLDYYLDQVAVLSSPSQEVYQSGLSSWTHSLDFFFFLLRNVLTALPACPIVYLREWDPRLSEGRLKNREPRVYRVACLLLQTQTVAIVLSCL